MGYMASWGPMGFIVSPQKIISLEKFTTSVTLKEDSENDTSGTPPTNTRGRELIPMSFSETCHASAGVDPLARYSLWSSLIGKSYPLLIGGRRIGPSRMKLKNVSMSDTDFTVSGDFIKATISITLEEWSNGTTSALLEEDTADTTSADGTGATGATGGTGGTGGTGSAGSTGGAGGSGGTGSTGGTGGTGGTGLLSGAEGIGVLRGLQANAPYAQRTSSYNNSDNVLYSPSITDEMMLAMKASMLTDERKQELAAAHPLLFK